MFRYNGTNANYVQGDGLTGGDFSVYVTTARRPRYLWTLNYFEKQGPLVRTLDAALEGGWEAHLEHAANDFLLYCEAVLRDDGADDYDCEPEVSEEEFESLTGEADTGFFTSGAPLHVKTDTLAAHGNAAGFNVHWHAKEQLPSGPMTAHLCWTIGTRKTGPRSVETEIGYTHTLGPESDCCPTWGLASLLEYAEEVKQALAAYAEECGFSTVLGHTSGVAHE